MIDRYKYMIVSYALRNAVASVSIKSIFRPLAELGQYNTWRDDNGPYFYDPITRDGNKLT